MAAITVEDCLKIVPNRFELVLIASYRAKQLMNGSPALYVSNEKKVEKNTIISLREIGENLLDITKIEEGIKNNIKNQKLFKSFEDIDNYESKKESDLEESISGEENVGEIDEEDDLEAEALLEEDDEDYYDNLGDDLSSDEVEEDLDK